MKVEIKKVDPVKRELRFEIPKERVSLKLEEVYKDIGKVAKVKGFRPGKVPRNVLEANHSRLAQEELVKQIIPEAYQEAIEKEKLSPVDYPEIEDVQFKDGIITFKATIDVKPEVVIKDYKGIRVSRKTSTVSEEEINKTLDFFKKDKDAVLDDAFARGLGYPSLEEFKKTLVRQLEVEKDRQNRVDIENQVIQELIKRAKVTAPSSMIKRQMENRLQDIRQRLQHQGMSKEDIEKKEKEIETELKEAVERDIKAYLIFDKIAQQENIEIKQGDNLPAKIIEFLLKEAQWESEKEAAHGK